MKLEMKKEKLQQTLQKDKHENVKQDIKIIKWGKEIRKCRYFRMCLSLQDHQSKASRHSNELTYLKTRVTTNQKHTKDSQKPKRTQV